MAECLIHRTGSMFKAFINVTGTPNSTVTATIGSKSFSGTTNTQGVATILVKKKGTYTVTSSASGTQTKTVEVTESKQTYSVNISGKFTISISHTNSAVSVTRNSSPYAGASTGALGNGAIVYYGDTFTVTGTANDGFDTWTKTVTGATANGNIYTVTGNVTVSTTASPTIYMLLISEGTGTTITVRRKTVGVPGMVAGAETGDLVHNSAIYKGDVLEATAVASGAAYNEPTLNLTNPSNYTVVGDTTVSATTTVKSYTLTIGTNSHNTVTVKRTKSPYQNASTSVSLSTLSTVYYGDELSFTQSPSAHYNGTYTVTNNGKVVIDKQTASKTTTVVGAVAVTLTSAIIVCTVSIVNLDRTGEPTFLKFTINHGTAFSAIAPRINDASDATYYSQYEKIATYPNGRNNCILASEVTTNSKGEPGYFKANGDWVSITCYPLDITGKRWKSGGDYNFLIRIYLWNASNNYAKHSAVVYTDRALTKKFNPNSAINGNTTLYYSNASIW